MTHQRQGARGDHVPPPKHNMLPPQYAAHHIGLGALVLLLGLGGRLVCGVLERVGLLLARLEVGARGLGRCGGRALGVGELGGAGVALGLDRIKVGRGDDGVVVLDGVEWCGWSVVAGKKGGWDRRRMQRKAGAACNRGAARVLPLSPFSLIRSCTTRRSASATVIHDTHTRTFSADATATKARATTANAKIDLRRILVMIVKST